MKSIAKENLTPKDAEHFAWVKSRPDLFGEKMSDWKCWSGFEADNQQHGAWKMHMYSVDEADWRKMCDALIPYLKDHDIDWKTFNVRDNASHLNGGYQEGKAFTIYPRNNEHMEQVAKDLDYLIRKNQLAKQGTDITGDRQLGDSGRLFYRYEYKSGQNKNDILDLSNPEDRDRYHYELYDGNRGPGNYLASDMTPADDPWLNFDPSDPNSKPGTAGNAAPAKNEPLMAEVSDDDVVVMPEQDVVVESVEVQPSVIKSADEDVVEVLETVDVVNVPKLSSDIDNANVSTDLDALQKQIDSLPDGQQKTQLQKN